MNSIRRHFPTLLWLFVTVMFLVGPIAVGRMGAYMRYVGDDYCFSSALKSDGFFRGQISSFQMVQRFAGDRYSLTLLSFTTELLGPQGNSAAVAVMVVFWLAGLYLVVFQLLHFLGKEHTWKPSMAASSAVTFFILLTYSDLFSAMYWVSALYAYFAPMVTIIWLSAAILMLLRARKIEAWKLLALFAITWIFGAFSEIGTVVQIAWLFIMALAIWKIKGSRFWSRDYKVLFVPLLATVIALITMMMSPYLRGFLLSSGPIINIGALALEVLRESAKYNLSPGHSFRTPFIVEVIILGAMGVLLIRRRKASVSLSFASFITMLLAIFMAGWLLVAAAFFPSYLGLQSYPSPRALMPAHIIRQLEYAFASIATGMYLGTLVNNRRRAYSVATALASITIIAASLYPLRTYPHLLEREPFMKKWSLLWDQRDEQIRKAVQRGEASIRVMELDHPIPGLAELGPNPNAAYNQCAQEYYGIPEINANLPGWDTFKFP